MCSAAVPIAKFPIEFMCRCTVLLLGYCILCYGAELTKYPNEIIDTPIVSCEQDNIVVKIRTSSANPSHIYAEEFHETTKCMVRNQNRIAFPHNDCGMIRERLENPAGTMYRICLSVQIHPLFVTDSDRSYCAQCVYMDANLVDDLERNIDISEMRHNELDPQFDEASNPQCSYSIRKGTVDGPEVHAAVVGDTVFHVWQCNNENVGILVQNCHVEDLQGDKILIIDQNGCGVDQYLFRTPQYSNDLHTAFLQSSVFKFVDKSMTRFRCQLRLCVKNRGKGCETITPPSECPNVDDLSSATDASPSSASVPSAAVHSSVEQQPYRTPSLVGVSSPSGRIEPPSVAVEAHGSSVVSGGTESVSVSSPTPKLSEFELPAGPPSIRPYGPGISGKLAPGAQIVSGKSSENAENIATLPSSSYPYLHREKRSTTFVIYGIGPSQRLAPPPLALRAKRHFGNPSEVKSDGTVQELDVVGLIRVLDNPDDIQYFADQQNSAVIQQQSLNGSEIPPTASEVFVGNYRRQSNRQQTVPQQRTVPMPSLGTAQSQQLLRSASIEERLSHPMPRAVASATSESENAEGQSAERHFSPEGSVCLSNGAFRGLMFTIGTLFGLQLFAVALVLIDRFLMDGKYVSQRLQKVLTSNAY